MGFLDAFKGQQAGTKALRAHSTAMQLRKQKKYQESEKKLDEALTLYRQALQMGEKRFNILDGYAVLLMRRGEFDRAREVMLEINKDKQLTPENRFQLRVNYAICQWRMGRLDKAIETMQRAVAMNKNSLAYNTMGLLLTEKAAQTGDFSEALAWNQEALDYDDEDPETLDNLGQTYYYFWRAMEEGRAEPAGDLTRDQCRDKACDYLTKAWKRKPTQVSSAYFLARLMHETGDDARAREALSTVENVPVSKMMQVSENMLQELKGQLS